MLDLENDQLRNNNNFLIGESKKVQGAEEARDFLQKTLNEVKTNYKVLQMEHDSIRNQMKAKADEVDESKRLYEMESQKMRMKESELREATA